MSRRNSLFIALTLGALLPLNRVFADETSSAGATTNKPAAFNASLRAGETVGTHQIQRAFLTVGTNQMAFIVPNGFFMDASKPGRIVISDNGGEYFITVRVTNPEVPSEGSPYEFFKGEALRHFPGAKISNQSSDAAANHSGPAFDLEWLSPKGGAQSARIAFIPCPAGVIEFSILSRTANFKDAQLYLSLLMSSVRSNETGKLVITPLPDFS